MYRPVEFNVATATYERQGQFREASQELLQLAHLCNDPALRADTWIRAARLQIHAGDAVAARASLQAAVEIDTKKPVSLFLLGDTWTMLGDTHNARAAYRRLIELAPNGPYGDVARTRLRSLPASANP